MLTLTLKPQAGIPAQKRTSLTITSTATTVLPLNDTPLTTPHGIRLGREIEDHSPSKESNSRSNSYFQPSGNTQNAELEQTQTVITVTNDAPTKKLEEDFAIAVKTRNVDEVDALLKKDSNLSRSRLETGDHRTNCMVAAKNGDSKIVTSMIVADSTKTVASLKTKNFWPETNALVIAGREREKVHSTYNYHKKHLSDKDKLNKDQIAQVEAQVKKMSSDLKEQGVMLKYGKIRFPKGKENITYTEPVKEGKNSSFFVHVFLANNEKITLNYYTTRGGIDGNLKISVGGKPLKDDEVEMLVAHEKLLDFDATIYAIKNPKKIIKEINGPKPSIFSSIFGCGKKV